METNFYIVKTIHWNKRKQLCYENACYADNIKNGKHGNINNNSQSEIYANDIKFNIRLPHGTRSKIT